jgi:hypothetical protein
MQMIVSLLVFAATFALVMGVAAFLRPRIAGRRLAKLGALGGETTGERQSLLVAGQENRLLRAISRQASAPRRRRAGRCASA